MNDEELTRLAVEQLIAEGEKFRRRHELRYQLDEPTRLKPNLKYFKNTLRNCLSSNNRKDKTIKSKAAKELDCWKKTIENSEVFKVENKKDKDKDCLPDKKSCTLQKLKQTPHIHNYKKVSREKEKYAQEKK